MVKVFLVEDEFIIRRGIRDSVDWAGNGFELPVATAFWTPRPNLTTGAESWILSGGAHHTAFSYDLTAEQMGGWADAMGIEVVYIDSDTTIRGLKNELRWNEAAYR